MAGEIQLNSTTMATESSGTITLSNVNSATNRTNLGLGSMATQAADSVSISGGNITGGTIGSSVVFPLDDLFPFTGSVQNIGKLRIVMGNATTGSETDNGSASAPFRYSAYIELADVDSGFAAMPNIFVTSYQSAAAAAQNQFITLSYSGGNIAADAIRVYMVSDVTGRVASTNINYLLIGEAA